MGVGRLRSTKELLTAYARGNRDFRGAELLGADLGGTNLSGVDFRDASLVGANFREANLGGADLSKADLREATLVDANLHEAILCEANLVRANLVGASLGGANLGGANLSGADLSGTLLREVNLDEANLFRANLYRATLDGATFGGARLGATLLGGVDLSSLAAADPPVAHYGPCSIDHEAIILSLRCPTLGAFLVRLGMPEIFASYMIDCARSVRTDVFNMMQSTFLSYGGPDEPFVRRLYEFLHRNGVTTFFFAEHAKAGEKLHRTMRDGVNAHDRVVLVCSKASLVRPGVLNEVEETLQREARDGGASYLVPIRLDDYVFSPEWQPANTGTAQAIRDRVVADFRGAEDDEAKFNAAGLRLLDALKKR